MNTMPRTGGGLDPYTAWFGPDKPPCKILGFLQPFGRIAYVTDRTKIKAKDDPRSKKLTFVGYANDHSGDTYKFFNPETRRVILSRDVHQWMEWHGRITATDDLDLFEAIDNLKTDSVILPASPVVPIVTGSDQADADDLFDVVPPPSLLATPEDPMTAAAIHPARRNLASSFGQGAVTRARARNSATGHRIDDIAATCAIDSTESFLSDIVIFNAHLQSDPQLGVPKNYKELLKLNDPGWLKSLNDELENFLKRDA